jgi:hypothetical protein
MQLCGGCASAVGQLPWPRPSWLAHKHVDEPARAMAGSSALRARAISCLNRAFGYRCLGWSGVSFLLLLLVSGSWEDRDAEVYGWSP